MRLIGETYVSPRSSWTEWRVASSGRVVDVDIGGKGETAGVEVDWMMECSGTDSVRVRGTPLEIG
jgi:hypothetical protein